MNKREAENILDYKALAIEVQSMRNGGGGGQKGPSRNHSDGTWATYRESRKLRNCNIQPYCALHTHCEK
jgi:hypothetical protein